MTKEKLEYKFYLLILLILILVGGWMRFTKLNWGEGHFFHPDERNIAGAVTQLKFPSQMNPHFFAYGSFPVYLYFFLTRLVTQFISLDGDTFTRSIVIGRTISAALSTLVIVQVYLLAKRLGNKVALISAGISTFTVGFIQYAHFSTVEMLQTSLFLAIFETTWKFVETKKKRWLIVGSLLLGIAIGTKVTSLLIIPVVGMAILRTIQLNKVREWLKIFGAGFLILLISASVAIAVFPYAILDFKGFKGGINYESGVATGKIDVFYIKQFKYSAPIKYHFQNVLPWSYGISATVLLPVVWIGVAMVLLWRVKSNKQLSKEEFLIFLIWLWINIFFGWHTTLFVKWVRYLIPIFPFLIILTAWLLVNVVARSRNWGKIVAAILLSFINVAGIYQSIRFISIYRNTDTRVAAGKWAEGEIGQEEKILTEIYDMGITAMPDYSFSNTKLFNFYDLDVDNQEERLTELATKLEEAQWILVPSRRIYGNVMRLSRIHPLANKYYELLFEGELGFAKKAEFFINTFYDDQAEETYEVFDHPKVMLFAKEKALRREEYFKLIKDDEVF